MLGRVRECATQPGLENQAGLQAGQVSGLTELGHFASFCSLQKVVVVNPVHSWDWFTHSAEFLETKASRNVENRKEYQDATEGNKWCSD